MQVNEIISNEVLEIAANWWINSLESPQRDNGDKSNEGVYTSILSLLAIKNDNTSELQASAFKKSLVSYLQGERAYFSDSHLLDVDYHPCAALAHAAKESGISSSRFSWKTTMWIYADKVVVRAGYGAPSQVIWQKAE